MSTARKACLLAVAFAALWTTVELIAHHVLSRYSTFQVVWFRYAVHLLLMLGVWGWREPRSLWATRRPGYQLGRSMLMLVMPGSWALAVSQGTEASTIMAIFWLSPILVLALASWLLGERPSAPVWVLSATGSVGAWLTYRPREWQAPHHWVLPVAMALSFSLYLVLSRPLRHETTRANLFYTALGVFLALSPLMPRLWIMPPLHDVGIFVAIGSLGYLALLAIDRFTALSPLSVTTPFLYCQVAFATAAESGDGIGRSALLGAAAITVVAFAAWRLARPLPVESPA